MNNSFHKQFNRNAEIFPHLLNIPSDQVMLSMLSEADFRKASFLDQRLITPQLKRQVVTWDDLETIKAGDTLPPYYIFHIGHVGSTLLSRLLGELPEVLALREPQILRDLTQISQIGDQPEAPWSPASYEKRRVQIISWLSRTFRENQRSMIKASSFVSELAEELIGPENKSVFLYVPLEVYMETILAGDGSRQEAGQLAGARLMRLNRRIGGEIDHLWQLSHTQQIALGWMCEMVTLLQTDEKKIKSDTIFWQDFNRFLDAPKEELLKIANWFDLNMRDEQADSLIGGPIMKSYSKSPDHDYSPALRQQLLQQSRAEFKTEIAQALEWVEDLAKDHSAIEKIVNFSD